MIDDVPEEEKRRRYQVIEELQQGISERKMARWLGKTVEVLVEDKHNGQLAQPHPRKINWFSLTIRVT
ncbi:MAG: hypothetical protein M5U34_21010 [Chloroflexi bacterium]|nr:hypothetical protein [Chloroflexota bacterium]